VRLSDVQHQDRALSVLRRALAAGRAHHAYLFTGPDGVGKERTALALAATLLCNAPNRQPEDDACGDCNACHLLASDNHPDFHLIHRGLHVHHPDRTVRASSGMRLVVDLIRHFLIAPAGMKPTQGDRRVFLIRDAQRMNEEAQNALLKTLEEPPPSATLILVTSSADRLLPTIRSRCQQVAFDLLPPDFIAAQLAARTDADSATAQALAALAGGRLGVALQWHAMDLLAPLPQLAHALQDLPRIGPTRFAEQIRATATELAVRAGESEPPAEAGDEDARPSRKKRTERDVSTDELRDAVKLILMLVAALLRDAMLHRTGATGLCALSTQTKATQALAERFDEDALDDAVFAIAEAEQIIDRNVAIPLACERLAVALQTGSAAKM
jgi:DNA polymerase-3 subunit delta'